MSFRGLVWLAIVSCLVLAVCTTVGSRPDIATLSPERKPLNGHTESMTPSLIDCGAIVGAASWDSAGAAKLRAIIRDSSAASDRAVAIETAFPKLATYEEMSTRACTLIGHGSGPRSYTSFIDTIVPLVLGARSYVAGTAPSLIAPEPGRRFKIYPRKTTVAWHGVTQADHYLLEVQVLVPVQRRTPSGEVIHEGPYWFPHNDGLHSAPVHDTVATFFFVGASPGRWRVRAAFADGRTTPPSAWRTFVYLE